jgi:hypothetical protein
LSIGGGDHLRDLKVLALARARSLSSPFPEPNGGFRSFANLTGQARHDPLVSIRPGNPCLRSLPRLGAILSAGSNRRSNGSGEMAYRPSRLGAPRRARVRASRVFHQRRPLSSLLQYGPHKESVIKMSTTPDDILLHVHTILADYKANKIRQTMIWRDRHGTVSRAESASYPLDQQRQAQLDALRAAAALGWRPRRWWEYWRWGEPRYERL